MNWDDIWRNKKYITDFSLRWIDFLSRKKLGLRPGAKVLEAGCGSGEGISIFSGEGRLAVGLDISEEAIKLTVSHSIHGVRGDNFMLPFPEGTFDLVYNSGVIEHFKYPGNIRQIKEMARVTKNGGEVIINVPNSLCLWYLLAKAVLKVSGRWKFGYEESYTPARLSAAVREGGLKITGLTGFLALPPFATDDREVLPLGLRRILASIEKALPLKEYYCYSVCVSCKKDYI